MIRRIALACALATLAALGGAQAASAQAPIIRAVDDLTGPNNRWEPSNVTIQVGETVTWSFEGTQLLHNVKSASANWEINTPPSTEDPRPVTYTFTAEGTYDFVCFYHSNTMRGRVTVGSPDPPDPPGPGETPFPNDQQPPDEFESIQDLRPRLSRVRVAARRHGARVRFRLSERARVTVRVKRGRRTVERRRVNRRRGTHRLYVGGLRDGRYRVVLRARDRDGNRSRVVHRRFRIR